MHARAGSMRLYLPHPILGQCAGTSSVEQSTGNVLHKHDAYAQTRTALEIVAHGLEALGSSMDDVVSWHADCMWRGCA